MITYDMILENLPKQPTSGANNSGMWTNSEDILCETEIAANVVAKFLENIGVSDSVCTGYYDPKENKRMNEITKSTGFYYVTCN